MMWESGLCSHKQMRKEQKEWLPMEASLYQELNSTTVSLERKYLLLCTLFVISIGIGRFTLRTDHASLTWLANFKEPIGQLARWLEQLQ